MRAARSIRAVVLTTALCVATPLRAQGPAEAARGIDAAREHSRSAFSSGVAALEDRRPREALALFKRAYELFPHFSTLYNIGLCERELGRPTSAAANFRRYLKEGGEGLDVETLGNVQRLLAEAESKIARLTIDVDPRADVRIDGSPTQDRNVELDPGEYVVEASAVGRAPFRTRVPLGAGERRALAIVLDPQPVAARVAPAEPRSKLGPTFWTFASIGAGAAIAGTVTGLVALSDSNAYENPATPQAEAEDRKSRGEVLRVVADVSFGVAIVAGVAALLPVLLEPSSTPSRSTRQPAILHRTGLLGLHGSF
jgi:hypothetical protein